MSFDAHAARLASRPWKKLEAAASFATNYWHQVRTAASRRRESRPEGAHNRIQSKLSTFTKRFKETDWLVG